MLEDRVTIVTGGTSGIGQATAFAFAREGAKVVVCGRREQEGHDTVARIQAMGGVAMFVKTDVTNEADVAAMVHAAVSRYGRLDAAFNNAGVGERTHDPIHEKGSEDYHVMMDTNVLGVFLSLKYEIEAMLRTGAGAIVNNSSVSGLIGYRGSAIYVASKHAVVGLTKAAALDYAARGIRVNAVAPGGTETSLLNHVTGGIGTEEHRRFTALHPIGRTGRPEEIAEAVVWLCSDKSSFVTGQTVPVDGGWTAQ
jgi:NAD(P)-dependent dehydrogenase (short-subunit alcohol dehydrogenase family)